MRPFFYSIFFIVLALSKTIHASFSEDSFSEDSFSEDSFSEDSFSDESSLEEDALVVYPRDALVVIDAQMGFLMTAPQELSERLAKSIEWAMQKNLHIVYLTFRGYGPTSAFLLSLTRDYQHVSHLEKNRRSGFTSLSGDLWPFKWPHTVYFCGLYLNQCILATLFDSFLERTGGQSLSHTRLILLIKNTISYRNSEHSKSALHWLVSGLKQQGVEILGYDPEGEPLLKILVPIIVLLPPAVWHKKNGKTKVLVFVDAYDRGDKTLGDLYASMRPLLLKAISEEAVVISLMKNKGEAVLAHSLRQILADYPYYLGIQARGCEYSQELFALLETHFGLEAFPTLTLDVLGTHFVIGEIFDTVLSFIDLYEVQMGRPMPMGVVRILRSCLLNVDPQVEPMARIARSAFEHFGIPCFDLPPSSSALVARRKPLQDESLSLG